MTVVGHMLQSKEWVFWLPKIQEDVNHKVIHDCNLWPYDNAYYVAVSTTSITYVHNSMSATNDTNSSASSSDASALVS